MKENICIIGYGDLAKKAAPSIKEMKRLGYNVVAVDFKEDPVGLTAEGAEEPSSFFDLSKKSSHTDFIDLASKERFSSIYISNPGDVHLPSALELQHFTNQLIISKPLDTNVDLISSITRYENHSYKHLVPKIAIHDHYLNKPGVQFLSKIMPKLHTNYKFLDSIQMYLVEKNSIEEAEPHRLEGLRCGMIFDLGIHLLSILDELVKEHLIWDGGGITNERVERKFTVTNCATGRFGGSFLGMSTVIPHRRAETFGIIELMLEEKIARSGGLTMENKVPILIVVGKGIPVDRYATRGLKAIYLKFQTDKEVTLDIDTHRFTGIDDNLLQKEGYYDLDFTQKGINSPLISAAHNSFKLEGFQYWSSASRNVSILYEGLQRAGSPRGYNQDRFCRDLESMLLREQGGFLQWDIPADLNRFIIGGPVNNSIA